MSRERFFITENDLFDRVMALGSIGVAVYAVMRRFSDGRTGELWLSPEGIAQRLERAPKYIAGVMSKLVKAGVVELRKIGGERSYFLLQNADISGKFQTNRQNADISARNKEYQELNTKPKPTGGNIPVVPDSTPPNVTDFSDHDAAAQQGMMLFNVRGNAWRKLFLDCIATSVRAGVEVLDSAEHMHAQFTRYRARGGLKSDWFFLTDLYGKPESDWGLDGGRPRQNDQRLASLRAFGLD